MRQIRSMLQAGRGLLVGPGGGTSDSWMHVGTCSRGGWRS